MGHADVELQKWQISEKSKIVTKVFNFCRILMTSTRIPSMGCDKINNLPCFIYLTSYWYKTDLLSIFQDYSQSVSRLFYASFYQNHPKHMNCNTFNLCIASLSLIKMLKNPAHLQKVLKDWFRLP